MKERKFFTTRNITYLAVLLAFVIVFQMISSFVPISEGVSLNLTLVPIVLGGIIIGVWGGAFLGLMFAVIVVIMSIAMPTAMMSLIIEDPGALVFFIFSTLVRGIAAGIVPALIFKPIAKKNARAATFVSAALAPITNTVIFILSTLVIFGIVPNLVDMSALKFFEYLIVTVSGVNFLIELALNLILAPAIYTVVRVVQKRRAS